MILTLIGWLLLLAFGALTVFCAYTFKTASKYDGEAKVMSIIFGFCAFIVTLFFLAIMLGEITSEQSIPDGCYRIYNENDTSFIPTGNGTVSPIVTSERHYLPINCP